MLPYNLLPENLSLTTSDNARRPMPIHICNAHTTLQLILPRITTSFTSTRLRSTSSTINDQCYVCIHDFYVYENFCSSVLLLFRALLHFLEPKILISNPFPSVSLAINAIVLSLDSLLSIFGAACSISGHSNLILPVPDPSFFVHQTE